MSAGQEGNDARRSEDGPASAGKAKKSAKKIAKKEAKKAAKKGTSQALNSKSEKMSGPSEESSHELPAFAKQLDTNHDGHLSREELSKAADSFVKLDRNHDGVLDANELSEMPAVPSTTAPANTPAAPAKRMGKKGGNSKGEPGPDSSKGRCQR